MKIVKHDNNIYPEFQTNGNAARFAMPFAKEMLSGNGLDIGCMKPEWAFPGAKMIDLKIDDEWDAFNLPDEKYDYIFSSHCVEHLCDWVGALDYWKDHLREGGIMFLYLPDYSQTYWRPWNNRKHMNILTPEYLKDYFTARNFSNILVSSGADLYNAFYAVAQK
jgi:predicted SAM-dependent methyltransferase|tara:strand:+ start:3217 stop:3708 length:492 start_codon:yes stop_codon:yes gene_type:complete